MPAKKYLTRRELVGFLNKRGYPISLSTFGKLAMPSRNQGPPLAGRWGRCDFYDPGKALAWAQSRFRMTGRTA
jgi:hypothetical protein